MKGMSNKVIFIGIIFLAVSLLVSFWYVTNILNIRDMAYLYSIGIISMIVTGINGLFYNQTKIKNKQGIAIYLGKSIFDVTILLFFAYAKIDMAFYYLILSVIANIFITIAIAHESFKIETKETDFHISIHDPDSLIPPSMVIPFYLMMFFLYGGLIWILGNTLISYPMFQTILGDLIGALPNSFGVGDAENVVFIIFIFALTEWAMKKIGVKHGTYNNIAVFMVAFLLALTSFELYHTLVYGTNFAGQISVAIFGIMGLSIYKATKSLLCSLCPLHDSNNFWGTILKKTVFGSSAFQGTSGSILSFIIPILMIVTVVAIVVYLKRKGKRR